MAMAVVPSEYVTIQDVSAAEESGRDGVKGVVTQIDPVGQIAFVNVRLDESQEIRLETYRKKIDDLSIANGAEVRLTWLPERTSIVLDAA